MKQWGTKEWVLVAWSVSFFVLSIVRLVMVIDNGHKLDACEAIRDTRVQLNCLLQWHPV